MTRTRCVKSLGLMVIVRNSDLVLGRLLIGSKTKMTIWAGSLMIFCRELRNC